MPEWFSIAISLIGTTGTIIAIVVGLKNIRKTSNDNLEKTLSATIRTEVRLENIESTIRNTERKLDEYSNKTHELERRVGIVEHTTLDHGKRIERIENK